ncbi:MAG: hypothetical protein IJU00_14880 [Selenomonas sp.]|nr:hypothetical protein [Selenomonas sp.]
MTVSVKAELARKNMKYKEAARAVGMSASTVYKKLEKNNFSLEEAESVFGLIGMELQLAEKSLCPIGEKN